MLCINCSNAIKKSQKELKIAFSKKSFHILLELSFNVVLKLFDATSRFPHYSWDESFWCLENSFFRSNWRNIFLIIFESFWCLFKKCFFSGQKDLSECEAISKVSYLIGQNPQNVLCEVTYWFFSGWTVKCTKSPYLGVDCGEGHRILYFDASFKDLKNLLNDTQSSDGIQMMTL